MTHEALAALAKAKMRGHKPAQVWRASDETWRCWQEVHGRAGVVLGSAANTRYWILDDETQRAYTMFVR